MYFAWILERRGIDWKMLVIVVTWVFNIQSETDTHCSAASVVSISIFVFIILHSFAFRHGVLYQELVHVHNKMWNPQWLVIEKKGPSLIRDMPCRDKMILTEEWCLFLPFGSWKIQVHPAVRSSGQVYVTMRVHPPIRLSGQVYITMRVHPAMRPSGQVYVTMRVHPAVRPSGHEAVHGRNFIVGFFSEAVATIYNFSDEIIVWCCIWNQIF